MRETKFRAWINASNCWADEIIISQVGDVWGYIAIKNDNKYFNAELEQFTGLLDKNGKEIYEGDIVSGCGSFSDVRYREDIAAFERFTKQGPAVLSILHSEILEVIGNIHENQELLK